MENDSKKNLNPVSEEEMNEILNDSQKSGMYSYGSGSGSDSGSGSGSGSGSDNKRIVIDDGIEHTLTIGPKEVVYNINNIFKVKADVKYAAYNYKNNKNDESEDWKLGFHYVSVNFGIDGSIVTVPKEEDGKGDDEYTASVININEQKHYTPNANERSYTCTASVRITGPDYNYSKHMTVTATFDLTVSGASFYESVKDIYGFIHN